MPAFKIKPGDTFGRLVVTARLGSRATVLCTCGRKKIVWAVNLRRGATTSCGCRQREVVKRLFTTHGQSRRDGKTRPEWIVWYDMIRRCSNPNDVGYEQYGGRGISVCERWRGDFSAFFADVGPRPSPKHSIDRKDNDGDYEPSNCRWATQAEQMRNTQRSILLTLDGKTQCLRDWARQLGITDGSLRKRLEKWGLRRALTTPKKAG